MLRYSERYSYDQEHCYSDVCTLEAKDKSKKTNSWWVKYCIQVQNFIEVEKNPYIPSKQKLYIAYGIIFNQIIEAGFLDLDKTKNIESDVVNAIKEMQKAASLKPFWRKVVNFAEQNINDGTTSPEYVDEFKSPSEALSIILSEGHGVLAQGVELPRKKFSIEDTDELSRSVCPHLAESAKRGLLNPIVFTDLVRSGESGEIKMVCHSLVRLINYVKVHILPKNFRSRVNETVKQPKDMAPDEGCPVLHAGKLGDFIRAESRIQIEQDD